MHAVLLPTGNLLFAKSNSNAYVYDPVTGDGIASTRRRTSSAPARSPGRRAHPVRRRPARLDRGDNFFGLNQIWIFDPVAETWTCQVDMRHGRWYPTATRLPDGRVLITSGWETRRGPRR